ncbi:MAG: 23S rRNA (adenine(2030)-N(6))-methyltransferase RlmJ [Gammaproteobacteria bacterium]|nr:23S rRNA (adenine(2030)-N(6))-methyltransferase RlmJ [Gammaproteobacteria bacterium]
MNYRHAFHAGNFADVHKHITLLALIESLLRKDTPCIVLETHAGAGIYDLLGGEARRTGEWGEGIGRLVGETKAPAVVRAYLQQVRTLNPEGRLRLYPGSPVLTAATLRPQDRLVLCELEPSTHTALREALKGRKGIAIHARDGWEALKALLPPREAKRGLVLIDPPFEATNELTRLADALIATHKRWPQGVLAAWYPIKDRPPLDRFLRMLRTADLPDLLVSELCIHPPTSGIKLNGSGMVIINTPWKLEDTLHEATAWLHDHLAHTKNAPWRVERLTGG